MMFFLSQSIASIATIDFVSVQEELEREMEREMSESGAGGQWLRRRRLDGSLSRVPVSFYPDLWKVLKWVGTVSVQKLVFTVSWLAQLLISVEVGLA